MRVICLAEGQLALSNANGDYRAGYQEVTFPKYERYVDAGAVTYSHGPLQSQKPFSPPRGVWYVK
jgi:hypothetical protein